MSSLADLPELVGFFSYARSDDENSDKRLSLLRKRIGSELRLQLGREVRLWQDTEAIPLGTLWEREIKKAVAESAFFIPIVTPGAVNSSFCRMEFEAFLGRESELRRNDLVFPVLYIRVPALANEDQRGPDGVLKIIHARQYADWTKIRLDDVASPDVGKQVARFCEGIVEALRKPWESPEERRHREAAETQRRAELEELRRVAEAEAARLAEEERRRKANAQARQREQLRRDAEAETRRQAEAERQREEKEERTYVAAKSDHSPTPPRQWRPSWRALVAGGLLGVVFVGSLLVRLAIPPEQVFQPATSAPPAPATTAATTPVQSAPTLITPGTTLIQSASGPIGPLSLERERALKPKDTFKECDNCPEMVVVPSGSFTMGSPESEVGRSIDEGPQRVVTIGKPLAVGKLHVTVDQFAAFMAEWRYDAGSTCRTFEGGKTEDRAGRSWLNPGFAQDGSHPAVCLSRDDAQDYVKWLAEKTHKPYRLLTEAEWEYAARARTTPGRYPRFWFGDDEKDLCRYGNGVDQKARDSLEKTKGWPVAPCNDGYAYTSPAGHFEANAFGLHDMFGNAWQWTADCYHNSYNGAPADGTAWTAGTCSGRLVRGGAWDSIPRDLRAAQRVWVAAGYRSFSLGFRLARTLIP